MRQALCQAFDPHENLGDGFCVYFHFTDEKSNAQSSEMICPGSPYSDGLLL